MAAQWSRPRTSRRSPVTQTSQTLWSHLMWYVHTHPSPFPSLCAFITGGYAILFPCCLQLLPKEQLYAPPLNIRIVDKRAFGRTPMVGTHVVKSVKSFFVEPRAADQRIIRGVWVGYGCDVWVSSCDLSEITGKRTFTSGDSKVEE